MATLRESSGSYSVGNTPPEVTWTVVRGDTASFRVYVVDDSNLPLNIPDWTIGMDVKRSGQPILSLLPRADGDDQVGEFTVFLAAAESNILETGDLFDIQLSLPLNAIVWTVAKGSMIIIEDVTE